MLHRSIAAPPSASGALPTSIDEPPAEPMVPTTSSQEKGHVVGIETGGAAATMHDMGVSMGQDKEGGGHAFRDGGVSREGSERSRLASREGREGSRLASREGREGSRLASREGSEGSRLASREGRGHGARERVKAATLIW